MDNATTHYTVLARRFRPQTFDEVIGQQHVAQGLRNAIRSDRVAHAYLFTGARGVGKTSMARILAKALNCPQVEDGVPCGACEICEGIAAGNDVDVMEIDGASNRGIDDIRALRANVNVKSMRTQFKLYIIDEVHMLTKEAFNALLKTLEEPPPNVKFVFCTTEPTKVPDTILSRCQRFDFATVAMQSIIERLHQIAQAEGFEVEPAALELVARRAAGSMRDSQSLFDQLLAFGSETISAEDVHRLLGTAPDERLTDLFESLVQRRSEAVLQTFEQALIDGVQLGEFVDQWIGYTRDLMVIAAGAESVPLSSVSETSRDAVSRQAKEWGLQTILAAMEILAETKSRMQRVTYGRALADLALVRIALLEDLDRLDDVIRGLKTGEFATAPVAAPAPRLAAPPPAPRPQVAPQAEVTANSAPQPDESSQPNSRKAAGENRPEVETQPVPTPQVEFSADRVDHLWSQVIDSLRDVTRDHVKGVCGVAISGPNLLELSFPASYDFSKQFCERPEVLSRLEASVANLTGRTVGIALKLVETENQEPATAEVGNDSATHATRDDVDRKHPFVDEATSIFDGTVVKVEGIGSPQRDTGASHGED